MNRHTYSLVAAIALALTAAWSLSSCSSSSNPTNSGGPPPPPNAISIAGFAFNPASLTVKAGSKVTWTNNDNTTHTVTSDDGTFTSSGNLASGAVYQFAFSSAGTFHYHCTIHPTMTGTITVTP
ncbi:hypothetical protein C3F09_11700 [candidate division GN15 bacterium]|uniref:EfeO-type cupredoxin-like domain-containing protein n=1 Tax=candidate division GN15 bacterium TaxID=2072418 RepID=A0A855X3K8_9BACT|nr:MAG: hypothetical protein C3F09_11700 [candidate division GN15 bacterium]